MYCSCMHVGEGYTINEELHRKQAHLSLTDTILKYICMILFLYVL